MIRLLSLLIFFFFTSCAQNEVHRLTKKINTHKVQTKAYWQFETNGNLEEKISTKLSVEVKDFLQLWKKKYHLRTPKNIQKSKIKSTNFSFVFRYAIINLPQELKVKLNRKIKKIFLVKDLGVSSLILKLKNKTNKHDGKFVIFYDQEVLNQGINDWYKWREQTAFRKSTNYSINPYLDHDNSTIATIQFALLQSLGVFATWDAKFFPTNNESLLNINSFPVLNTSWRNNNRIIQPKFKGLTRDFSFIKYYTHNEPLHDIEKAKLLYEELEKTNFPDLYASTSIAKDLIESMASYLHVSVLKRPFQIEFLRGKKTSASFSNCWERPRCYKKKLFIQEIYNQF